MSEEKEAKEKEAYNLVEVPTQMGLAVKTPEEKIISMEELIVDLANRIHKLEKLM